MRFEQHMKKGAYVMRGGSGGWWMYPADGSHRVSIRSFVMKRNFQNMMKCCTNTQIGTTWVWVGE